MAFQNPNSVDARGSTFNDISGHQLTLNIGQVIQTNADLIPSLAPVANAAGHCIHPGVKMVPLCSKFFTGRREYLEKLQQYFCRRDVSYPGRRFLLYGMGGAGKTQICLKFAEENSDMFWRIFWVDATRAETIKTSLEDIATDPDARASGVKGSTESVLRWLSRVEREWLILYDNADCDPHVVAEYFPPGNRGNILLTSRNQGLGRYVLREASAEVENMENEDAIALLLKSASLDGSSMEIKSAAGLIVEELCFFPLAVDQAGAAITNGHGLCNINDYLQLYSQHRQELLADRTFQGASNYGRAVYGTWDLSLEAITTRHDEAVKSAIFILQIFSFFHHQSIREEIFKRAAEAYERPALGGVRDPNLYLIQDNAVLCRLLQLAEGGRWDPFSFREGIRILLSFSLIKREVIGNAYSVHPLVHGWSQDSMSNREQMKSCASYVLSSSISFTFTSEDYAFRRMLLPHIKPANLHDIGLEMRESINDEQCTKFGLVFYENGHWKEAEEQFVQVMEMRKRVLGVEHPYTLKGMANLASTFWIQGWWKKAEELFVQVMEIRKRVLGVEHPSTLASISHLASTYRNQGQSKEAEGLNIQVMGIRKKQLGEEHPDTLASMANLASTYQNQGRWKEAEGLGLQVMEMRKKLLGEEHPDTLTSMANLALTYQTQGRWKEAKELGLQVMEMRKMLLGEEHPDALSSMANLASAYHAYESQMKAVELEVQVMEMRKRVLGEEHPDTLSSMANLASAYHNQESQMKAMEIEVQVMVMRKRVLGEEHPDTLSSMGNLASTYWDQGHQKKAEELENQVIEIRKRVLGRCIQTN